MAGVPASQILESHGTKSAARHVPCPPYKLRYLIECGDIPEPPKNDLGHYVWTPDDIERVREVLRNPRRRRAANPG